MRVIDPVERFEDPLELARRYPGPGSMTSSRIPPSSRWGFVAS